MKTNPTMQAEAVLPARPVSKNGKINILTRLAYGGGDVACNVVYGMIGDVVEFGQWKHHIRQESFIFAVGSVGTKLGTGIAQASIAGIMSLCGYISSTGSTVVQSQSSISSTKSIPLS